MANFSSSSLEDHYHGGSSYSVSIPFNWESEPGTPKAKYFIQNSNLRPPLTPPPCYFYANSKRPSRKKYSNNILPKVLLKSASTTSRKVSTNNFISSSPPSSSSSSSESSTTFCSVPSSPMTPAKFRERGRSVSSSKVLVDSRMDCDEYGGYCSRVSTNSGCYSQLLKVFLREFR